MTYTLKQAAEASGKSKPTILRAIQSGKISGFKNDNEEWEIEPVELHRVYKPIERTITHNGTNATNETTRNTKTLQVEIDLLREQMARIEQMSDRERIALSRQLEDLRNERDQWRGQADKWQEQAKTATRLLEDHRQKEPEKPPERLKGFWARMFGRTA